MQTVAAEENERFIRLRTNCLGQLNLIRRAMHERCNERRLNEELTFVVL